MCLQAQRTALWWSGHSVPNLRPLLEKTIVGSRMSCAVLDYITFFFVIPSFITFFIVLELLYFVVIPQFYNVICCVGITLLLLPVGFIMLYVVLELFFVIPKFCNVGIIDIPEFYHVICCIGITFCYLWVL